MRRLVLVVPLLLCAPGLGRAGEPKLYLSWGAANDLPGATSSITWTCGDTTHVDTLYFSFDPGRACSTFVGMTADISIRSLSGDSLGPLWQSPGGRKLPRWMKFEFGSSPGSGYPFPWEDPGVAGSGYMMSGRTVASLRAIIATSQERWARVEGGRRYGLARLLLRRPPAGSVGCDQPMCIEWEYATMAFDIKDEPKVSDGVLYAGINATAGDRGCGLPASSVSQRADKAKKPKKQPGNR